MHIGKLLHNVFVPASKNIDKRLHRSLLEAALTLTDCRHLSIAGIGRCLRSTTAVKYTIKRIDRLFGNLRLHDKRHVLSIDGQHTDWFEPTSGDIDRLVRTDTLW